MGREYGLGCRIVAAAVLVAVGLSITFHRSGPPPVPAGENLGGQTFPIGPFALTERSGRAITEADLADRAWIACFIFTRCPLSCPRITTVMKGLQEKLKGSRAQLVSISVDPAYDRPEVLRKYAENYGADPDRWWFLTGDRDAIDHLIEKRFKLSVSIPSPEERQAGAEAVMHSDRLALVDRGRLVGLYDSKNPEAIARLIAGARRRSLPGWALALPSVNATLNGLCALLLVAGWSRIRGRPAVSGAELLTQPRVRQHRALMIAAVVASAVFLGCYLLYHGLAGSTSFRGQGWSRPFYFTVLYSHTVLAALVVPLAVLALVRAIRGDFTGHARTAKVTFPIWLYVSVTGVVIYLMLYRMPVSTSMVAAPM
jgi:protein SCO1/2/putative membrane protein